MKIIYLVIAITVLTSCRSRGDKFAEYHQNGRIRVKGYMLDGELNSSYESYHNNGQLRSIGAYSKGRKVGLWKQWHSNGKQANEGRYKDGKAQGPWRFWHDTGRLEKTVNMVDDKEHGFYKQYYPSGKLMQKGFMVENLREGENWQYDSLGNLYNYLHFEKGIRNGPYVEYRHDGCVSAKGYWRNDQLYGRNYWYAEEGECDTSNTYYIMVFDENGFAIDTAKFFKNGKLVAYQLPIEGEKYAYGEFIDVLSTNTEGNNK